jgi:hypothetical protein
MRKCIGIKQRPESGNRFHAIAQSRLASFGTKHGYMPKMHTPSDVITGRREKWLILGQFSNYAGFGIALAIFLLSNLEFLFTMQEG